MSERFELNDTEETQEESQSWTEAFDDTKLGFAVLPSEIRIDSPADIAQFEAEHGVNLSSFLEKNA